MPPPEVLGRLIEALARFVDALRPFVQYLAGLVSAYLLFEFTEWRRRVRQARATVAALRAELRSVETILSTIVVRLAYGYPDAIEDVGEFRRLVSDTVQRNRLDIDPREAEQKVRSLLDEDLAKYLLTLPRQMETSAIDFHVPVLDATLASQGAGLGPTVIERLSMARWQIHLLNHEARWIEEWLRASFTITDPTNHDLAEENLKLTRRGYRTRARVTLETVREALAAFPRGRTP